MFARIVFDQTMTTWLRLHVEAFESFGGVPEVVVPDNLKAAVIRAAFTAADVSTLNRSEPTRIGKAHPWSTSRVLSVDGRYAPEEK